MNSSGIMSLNIWDTRSGSCFLTIRELFCVHPQKITPTRSINLFWDSSVGNVVHVMIDGHFRWETSMLEVVTIAGLNFGLTYKTSTQWWSPVTGNTLGTLQHGSMESIGPIRRGSPEIIGVEVIDQEPSGVDVKNCYINFIYGEEFIKCFGICKRTEFY